MTRRELIELCLAYPDAYEDYPFSDSPDAAGAWAVIRHRSNRKSFALVYDRGGLCVNLKCEPLRSELLRQAYPAVTPAYHMNKEHWNTVRPDGVPADELAAMLEISYRLTLPPPRRKG